MSSTMTKFCLVLAIVLSSTVSAQGIGGLLTKIRQLKPKVEAAVDRVAVGVACLISICTLQFSSLADAHLLEMSSRMELLRRRNVFTYLNPLNVTKGTRVAKWLGTGGVVEQESVISHFEAGLDIQLGNRFNFFLNGRLKNQKTPFYNVKLEPEIRTGMDFIMGYDFATRDGVGYINAEFLLTEGYPRTLWMGSYYPDEKGWELGRYNLQPLSLRFYLFITPHLAGLGIEYFDGDNEKLLGTEDLNGYLLSLFRISARGESFLPGERGIVEKGLNMTYGLGIFHQEEVEEIFREKLLSGIFVRLGGHLDYILYAGRLNIGFAGENKTVTGGSIDGIMMENSFNMTTEIVVFPEHDIRLEGGLNIIQQMLISAHGTGLLHGEDRGGTIMFLVKKNW